MLLTESVRACVRVSVRVRVVGAVHSCQSRAEEATFSSFSRGLLALCNRSALLPPGCRPSMLTPTLRRSARRPNTDTS